LSLADRYEQRRLDATKVRLFLADTESERYLKEAAAAREAHLNRQIKTLQDALRDAHDESAAARRAAQLQQQIETLEVAVHDARNEVIQASELTALVTKQKEELEASFEEMKREYTQASLEWEDRIEGEQTGRVKDRKLAEQVMAQMQHEAVKKIKQTRADGHLTQESVRSDLSNTLWHKETLLQKAQLSLTRTSYEKESLEDRLADLEWEREDLAALTMQTLRVATEKATSKLRDARNLFRRDKLV
jgi:hypothetical protein